MAWQGRVGARSGLGGGAPAPSQLLHTRCGGSAAKEGSERKLSPAPSMALASDRLAPLLLTALLLGAGGERVTGPKGEGWATPSERCAQARMSRPSGLGGGPPSAAAAFQNATLCAGSACVRVAWGSGVSTRETASSHPPARVRGYVPHPVPPPRVDSPC